MSDDFVERFGLLTVAPRHPNNPADPSVALYSADGPLARRFDFDTSEPGNAWAVDTKTGERAFRVDAKGRTFLPDGRQLATPKLTKRQPADPSSKLYGKKTTQRRVVPARTDAERLAERLYPRKRK